MRDNPLHQYTTGRLYAGRRHIIAPDGSRALCGLSGTWQHQRPWYPEDADLTCRKCRRALARESQSAA